MAAPGEQVRRRKAADAGQEPATPPGPGHDPAGCPARLRAGTFWLTRIVLLRALAFVYCESAGPALRRYRSSARARDSRRWLCLAPSPGGSLYAPPPPHATAQAPHRATPSPRVAGSG